MKKKICYLLGIIRDLLDATTPAHIASAKMRLEKLFKENDDLNDPDIKTIILDVTAKAEQAVKDIVNEVLEEVPKAEPNLLTEIKAEAPATTPAPIEPSKSEAPADSAP